MRKVNLEVIRKELYNNLSEMFFGAFYHMSELSKVYFDDCDTNKYKVKTLYDTLELSKVYFDDCDTNKYKVKTLYDTLEIKRIKPFSDYEYTIYITVEKTGVSCFFANTENKCYDYQWYVSYSGCKNKTVLYMKVVQQLTMQILN